MVTQNAGNIPTGASGTVLQGAGVGTAPTYSTPTYPSASGSTGTVLRSDGTNNVYSTTFTIDSSGIMKNSAQPIFSAYNSTALTNVTGDGTVYTLVLGSTTINVGTSYNTANGIFTAPVTGTYLFTASVQVGNLAVGHTLFDINLVTSITINSRFSSCNPNVCKSAFGNCSQSGSFIVKLTAADTAKVTALVSGSTKTVSVIGEATGTTFFAGFLLG